MPEMSFDVETFAETLSEYVATETEVFGKVSNVTEPDENMRSGGYFFDFVGPDGHQYTVEVSERS